LILIKSLFSIFISTIFPFKSIIELLEEANDRNMSSIRVSSLRDSKLVIVFNDCTIQCQLEVTQCELTLGLWQTLLSSYQNT
jgi:hypothetical protein